MSWIREIAVRPGGIVDMGYETADEVQETRYIMAGSEDELQSRDSQQETRRYETHEYPESDEQRTPSECYCYPWSAAWNSTYTLQY